MRTAPVIRGDASPSPPQLLRYRWAKQVGTPFTNNTASWLVIIGANFLAVGVAQGIQVKDAGGTDVDDIQITATSQNNTLDHHMLVPPGGTVILDGGGPTFFSYIQCASLEDAVAIL